VSTPDDYPLGRTDSETRRLIAQNDIYGPITRRMFEAAGIGAGMSVLDVGSGAGDVALLLAELVGPRGRVVGVDMNSEILETARARAKGAGWNNITFHAAEVRQATIRPDFDAVVGRLVLMYIPEHVELLRFLSTLLRPGGIIAFCEMDMTYPPTTFPPTELAEQLQRWMIPPFDLGVGAEMQMGTKLFNAFVDAGLPAPELQLEAPIGGGPDWPGYDYTAETLRNLMPALQAMIGLDPSEVDIETLAQRIREDALANRAVQMLPMLIGAWSRKVA
jgi:ubiquinone/menaquinone biosynthesis C-methylase UbiE